MFLFLTQCNLSHAHFLSYTRRHTNVHIQCNLSQIQLHYLHYFQNYFPPDIFICRLHHSQLLKCSQRWKDVDGRESLSIQTPMCSHKEAFSGKTFFYKEYVVSNTFTLDAVLVMQCFLWWYYSTNKWNSNNLIKKRSLLDHKNILFPCFYHCHIFHWYTERLLLQANYNMQLHRYSLWHITQCRP